MTNEFEKRVKVITHGWRQDMINTPPMFGCIERCARLHLTELDARDAQITQLQSQLSALEVTKGELQVKALEQGREVEQWKKIASMNEQYARAFEIEITTLRTRLRALVEAAEALHKNNSDDYEVLVDTEPGTPPTTLNIGGAYQESDLCEKMCEQLSLCRPLLDWKGMGK